MLRTRDIVAVLAAVWLVQMAWNDEHDFLSASLHLAFYTRGSEKTVAPLDVDGDGTVEALVVASNNDGKDSWKLEILDLKPLHKAHNPLGMAPFRPQVILASSPISATNGGAEPIKLTTGQIMVKKREKRIVTLTEHETSDYSDRSRDFYCGIDWHDAATNCHKPCPSGTQSDCDEGHKCFADTPCNEIVNNAMQDSGIDVENDLQLSPAGGLPSVVSLWSDGTVRLHSLTAEKDSSQLQLREMWSTTVNPMDNHDIYDLLLLGAEDVSPTSSTHKKKLGHFGMVIVGGTRGEGSMVVALDAMTGQSIWNSYDHVQVKNEQQALDSTPTPIRGTSSFARRRSRIVSATESAQEVALPNCWMAYRHSLLREALPYGYWGPADANWRAVHLDHSPKKPSTTDSQKNFKHKWHRRHRKGPIYGKPNVLLSHASNGIYVRSIKNGKAICHLSLLDHVLYSDLNHDGTLDQLQVVTSDNVPDSHHNEWIANLASQLGNQGGDPGKKADVHRKLTASSRLCHVFALSGLPAREELFVGNLCGSGYARDRADHASIDLFAAPPLVTTSKKMGADVVVALSNGMVSKHNVQTGRRLWQLNGQGVNENFPTWGAEGDAALTANIQVARAPFAQGPILLAGENGMVIITAGSGKILASSVFPQTSRSRPILADLSGDGTTDVIIASHDALWGYQIVVRTGAFVLFRIMVGLLLMAMALALLRNRFGQRSDKRSTDE